MCMAWAEPLSNPFASMFTETVSPFSCSLAVPLAVTWLVGTGWADEAKGRPAAVAGVGFDDPPPLSATTAATTPATTSNMSAAAGHLYFDTDRRAGGDAPPA